MILSSGAELSWKHFIEQPQFKNLSLNEQIIAYDKYLSYLSNIRNSSINFQNKGRLRGIQASPGNPVACIEGMDVVFLIDYTETMGDEIDAIKLNIVSIINTIITESGGDYRLGLVTFDEHYGNTNTNYGTNVEYTSLPAAQRYVNFNAIADRSQWITAFESMSTGNNTSFTSQLNKLNNVISLGDGAQQWDPGGIGFEQVVLGIAGEFRDNVSKFVIIITDAKAGGDDDDYTAIDDDFFRTLGSSASTDNVRALILSANNQIPSIGYSILAEETNGSFTADPTLAPNTIIQIIQDICS